MAFVAFALVRMAATLGIGPPLDRIGAPRMLPLFLLALALGMAGILVGTGSAMAALVYFALTGITTGITASIATVLWTGWFRIDQLGIVRAAASGAGVIASAAAPALFGLLLDLGVTMYTQAALCLAYLVVASLLTLPRARRRPAPG